jgi:hypothetical protein
MQSNRARVLVALGSIAAIAVLLIVFAGGDDEEDGEPTVATTTTTTSESGAEAETTVETGQPDGEKEKKKQQPEFTKIEVVGGEPKGGVAELSYKRGDQVRLEIVSDVDEEIHVHGYDLFEEVAAGGTARFDFAAEIEGVFEVELEAGGVQLAQLRVNP